MALKNLLLHIDDTKACAKRMDYAIELARLHDAHLSAVYCIGEYKLPGWADMPSTLEKEQKEREEKRAKAKLDEFADRAKRAGINYETREARARVSDLPEVISIHGRYADLVILGQVDPNDPPAGGDRIVEHVVISCGRPVLVVPYVGAPERKGVPSVAQNIMVGWDAGREATRAVNDALPLLEQAKSVDVVSVNPKKVGKHGDEPGADIGLHLSRHQVKVNVQHLESRDIDPGDTLLSRVSDKGCDLLVIGGYAHSRLRDLVVGGVTETMLEHMTVPVLMSH
jgi:nucleotide-binding universal stress UspA family protein